MRKHPTPPPADAAFLAERDPAKIRDYLTRYFAEVLEWKTDADLLHAFETVWEFQQVGRGISYLIMGTALETACYADLNGGQPCGCFWCEYYDVFSHQPINLSGRRGEAPSDSDPHAPADAESSADQAVSALPQVQPRPQPRPDSLPGAAARISAGRTWARCRAHFRVGPRPVAG